MSQCKQRPANVKEGLPPRLVARIHLGLFAEAFSIVGRHRQAAIGNSQWRTAYNPGKNQEW
jgi:hypothetical protein